MRRATTFDRVLVAISSLIALTALVLVVVANGTTRLGMVLVLLSSTLNVGLTIFRIRHRRP